MAFGKMVTGIWLVRFSLGLAGLRAVFVNVFSYLASSIGLRRGPKKGSQNQQSKRNRPDDSSTQSNNDTQQTEKRTSPDTAATSPPEPSSATKPKSLYPPSILGLAMIARGEVGYLIASLAQSQGIFDDTSTTSRSGSSEIYLVIIWAISICTLIGPIAVGFLVRRVKRLQDGRSDTSTDPLGVWGI
jgi:hypothetical protein